MERENHEKAMQLSHQAMIAREEGDAQRSLQLYEEAYELEYAVFSSFLQHTPVKPTSVGLLGKSVYWLAYKAGLYQKALNVIEEVYKVEGVPFSLIQELKQEEQKVKIMMMPHKGYASLTMGLMPFPKFSISTVCVKSTPDAKGDVAESKEKNELPNRIKKVFLSNGTGISEQNIGFPINDTKI